MIERFNLSPTRRPKAHFTLIELLVVMAIISILASMLLPATFKALQRVRALSCGSNLPQWFVAIESYADDYGEAYPGLTFWGNNDRFTTNWGGYTGVGLAMMKSFGTYMNASATTCPSRKEARHPGAPKWPVTSDMYWNPMDYFMLFGRADRVPTDPLYDGYGWTTSYWSNQRKQGYGPVATRVQGKRVNTPILFDRIWTPANPGYYGIYPDYNQYSNHQENGDRWADGGNILLLDGSYAWWRARNETWVYYGHDYYNTFLMPREVFVQ